MTQTLMYIMLGTESNIQDVFDMFVLFLLKQKQNIKVKHDCSFCKLTSFCVHDDGTEDEDEQKCPSGKLKHGHDVVSVFSYLLFCLSRFTKQSAHMHVCVCVRGRACVWHRA